MKSPILPKPLTDAKLMEIKHRHETKSRLPAEIWMEDVGKLLGELSHFRAVFSKYNAKKVNP